MAEQAALPGPGLPASARRLMALGNCYRRPQPVCGSSLLVNNILNVKIVVNAANLKSLNLLHPIKRMLTPTLSSFLDFFLWRSKRLNICLSCLPGQAPIFVLALTSQLVRKMMPALSIPNILLLKSPECEKVVIYFQQPADAVAKAFLAGDNMIKTDSYFCLWR